ncbi:UNVERIFIED_CONTAM: hypothetical protein RMT77_005838 [Armadillidium vulgare]
MSMRDSIFQNLGYTKSPEGEDCLYKIYWTTKIGMSFGLFFGSCDAVLYSHPVGAMASVLRVASVAFPFVIAPATFAAVACAATNFRKKDDHLNFMLAGGSAGLAFGKAWGNNYVGMGLGAFCAVCGLFMKDAMLNNWHFGGGRIMDLSEFFDKRIHTRYPSQRENADTEKEC